MRRFVEVFVAFLLCLTVCIPTAQNYAFADSTTKQEAKVNKEINKVVKHAIKRAKEHHKYKSGGRSWTKGIDCHGFTGMVYKECGFKDAYRVVLYKGSTWDKKDKIVKKNYKFIHRKKGLSKKDLRKGDIVITKWLRTKSGTRYKHSAIYIGNGRIAEAVRKGTRIGKLDKRYKTAYRIIGEKKKIKKATREKLVEYATKRAQDKRNKYKNSAKHMKWGGYMNCTWFVKTVYKDCGYSNVAKLMGGKYYRKPYAKKYLGKYIVAKSKKELKASQLEMGDIVVKKTKRKNVWHSAIYIGRGKVAEATKGGTRIGKIKGRKYLYAFRVIKK